MKGEETYRAGRLVVGMAMAMVSVKPVGQMWPKDPTGDASRCWGQPQP